MPDSNIADSPEAYHILPFQFAHTAQGDVLLVNECGDFQFLPHETFDNFVRHRLRHTDPAFFTLKSHLFLAQDELEVSLQKMAARYRTRKSFLRDFTALHMMVITLRCNQRCDYCQVSCAEEDAHAYDMGIATARRVVDMIFHAPTCHPKIEFEGGEPLLNWPVVEASVLHAEQCASATGKNVDFVICTNLTAITEAQLHFCRDHRIALSTSLDGPEYLHDACRKTRAGGGTHALFLEKLGLARRILGHDAVDALMTTSAVSIDHLEKVIEEYERRGMTGIFIRSLNPYGFAAEQAASLGYKPETFVRRYLEALDAILDLNRRIFFPEHFATLLFSRILTPFATGFVDLQSPAGAGISGAIYDYDGSVFPTDEARMLARMGDRHFCLGNILHDSYTDIFSGPRLKALTTKACVETTPPCAWCVYQSYCGTDPVRNYLETGDELRNMAGAPFCIKHKLIFDGMFERLRYADDKTQDIIWSWITRNPNLVQRHENA